MYYLKLIQKKKKKNEKKSKVEKTSKILTQFGNK